eukprot:CAMPEP_0168610126 /NCGR_PEP_ID=MMETSP0449_2-20121227/1609_1 /TAXON_ID=1082188 /ORGANISM="Strombidium rassoulzadegani, Strain ras09" /LENGTH=168 /DNA_ID=CAMNT_0008650387 /DNA_START=174 /DNA_END=680 /DNA_ORIENTATION=+
MADGYNSAGASIFQTGYMSQGGKSESEGGHFLKNNSVAMGRQRSNNVRHFQSKQPESQIDHASGLHSQDVHGQMGPILPQQLGLRQSTNNNNSVADYSSNGGSQLPEIQPGSNNALKYLGRTDQLKSRSSQRTKVSQVNGTSGVSTEVGTLVKKVVPQNRNQLNKTIN